MVVVIGLDCGYLIGMEVGPWIRYVQWYEFF